MAIWININKEDEDSKTLYYSFSNIRDEKYGILAIEKESHTIILIEKENDMGEKWAFPKVKFLIESKIKRSGLKSLTDSFEYRS